MTQETRSITLNYNNGDSQTLHNVIDVENAADYYRVHLSTKAVMAVSKTSLRYYEPITEVTK